MPLVRLALFSGLDVGAGFAIGAGFAGAAGAFCAGYLYLFYQTLSSRPGAPILQDVIVAIVGMLILLEATRRALGPPLMVMAGLFLFYPSRPRIKSYSA